MIDGRLLHPREGGECFMCARRFLNPETALLFSFGGGMEMAAHPDCVQGRQFRHVEQQYRMAIVECAATMKEG